MFPYKIPLFLLIGCLFGANCSPTKPSTTFSEWPADHHDQEKQQPVSVAPAPPSSLDTIYLFNPSFEDKRQCCTPPQGWLACPDMEGMSPPDVQPGSFGIEMPPSEGFSYVSMVVRDNNTNECLYQKLPKPLVPGNKYRFSIDLAQAEFLFSISATNGERADYDSPTKLLIGGMDSTNGAIENLAVSPVLHNVGWKKYSFYLEPNRTAHHLVLSSDWGLISGTNGHIFMDNCSSIVKVQN